MKSKVYLNHMLLLCTLTGSLGITQSASIPKSNKCILRNIKTQEEFDIKKFTGTWFEIAYVHHHGDKIMSAVSHYDIAKDGKLRVEKGGAIEGKCITSHSSVYTLPSQDDANVTFTFENHWVVNTDYDNYALLYECEKFNTLDDQCPDGQESLSILSRKSQLEAEILVKLQNIVENVLCIDTENFTPVTYKVTCPVQSVTEPMVADEADVGENAIEVVKQEKSPIEQKEKNVVEDNNVTEATVKDSDNLVTTSVPELPVQLPEEPVAQNSNVGHSNESAVIQNTDFEGVQSQKDFDAEKFAGLWYHSYSLKWSRHEFVSELKLVNQEDGTIKAWSKIYPDGPQCTTVYTQSKEHKGDWSFDVYGGMKLLYTDYDNAILYICYQVERDGHCKHEYLEVEILTRTKSAPTSEAVDKMFEAVKAVGLSKDDLTALNYTEGCEKSCKVSDYMAQQDLDVQKMSGLWYEIERTRYSDTNSWESGVAKYEVKEGGALEFSYVGTRSGKCQGPFKGYGKPVAEKSGEFNMYIGGEQLYYSPWSVHFTYKILYTDYNVAITYACMFWNNDGSCRRPSEQVDILSRTPVIDAETRSKLHNIIREQLCVDVNDLVVSAREADKCYTLDGLVDCSGRPMCMMECETGFVKGNDGCDTCKCADTENYVKSSGESEINVEASGENEVENVVVGSGDSVENMETVENNTGALIKDKAEVSKENDLESQAEEDNKPKVADPEPVEDNEEDGAAAAADDEMQGDAPYKSEYDSADENETEASDKGQADAPVNSEPENNFEEEEPHRPVNKLINKSILPWWKHS